MTALLLLYLTQIYQGPQTDEIWKQISQAELELHEGIKKADSPYSVSSTNPARGYYLPGKGVFFVVPLRYRALSAWKAEEPSEQKIKETIPLGKVDYQSRLAAWQERQKAYEVLQDANFQKIVTAVKQRIPAIAALLKELQPNEDLVIAVEEAPPAYYYADFSLKKNPTRKVVTLTVSGAAFQLVRTDKTERRDAVLMNQIQSVTTQRRIAGTP